MTVSQITMYKTLQRILHDHELSCISKKFYLWKYLSKVKKVESSQTEVQTDKVEFRGEAPICHSFAQTDEIVVDSCEIAVSTEIQEFADQNIGTEIAVLTHQDIQTEDIIEDRKDSPPRLVKKDIPKAPRPIKNPKNIESVQTFNQSIEKEDFPCQENRVLSSRNKVPTINEERKDSPTKIVLTARAEMGDVAPRMPRDQEGDSEEEYLQEEIIIQNESDQEYGENDQEYGENDEEEIGFSICGESSIDQFSESEQFQDQAEKGKTTKIKIPKFSVSKTYDKRSSMHNMRYI